MTERLLHVFRNTPLGRETFLQALYFCRTLEVALHIYVPESKQFLMYFEHDMVQVDLDSSYLAAQSTAMAHAQQLADGFGVKPVFFTPKDFTASQLPDIPTHYSYMSCPRSISDLSSKIGLGYIGPKVRRIIQSSTFPVLMPSSVFKPWESITVFYGGSNNANKALRWGLHLNRLSGKPVDLFTFSDGRDADYFEAEMKTAGLLDRMRSQVRDWHRVDSGSFEESLYTVSHDSLLMVGAYGHGLIKEFLFGSKMETIQSWMPNNMLLVGPHCVLGQ